MPRETCAEGIDLIKSHESLRLAAYDDKQPNLKLTASTPIKGTLTIGWGHTSGVKWSDTCTPAQAEKWLDQDLDYAEGIVERHVTVELNDHEFAALVSFVYNVGPGRAAKGSDRGKDGFVVLRTGKPSTLLRLLNANDRRLAAAEFAKWNKSGGMVMAGLTRRRAEEAALFLKPMPGEIPPPVPAEVEPQPSHASTAARGAAAAAGGGVAVGGVVAEAAGVGSSARSFLESESVILIAVGVVILAVGAYLLWRRFKPGASS